MTSWPSCAAVWRTIRPPSSRWPRPRSAGSTPSACGSWPPREWGRSAGTYAASMAYPVPEKPVPQDGAGVPDGFQRLWMPHRMAYIKGENQLGTGPEGCPFCQIPRLDDAEGLIVARGTLVFTVL